MLMHSPPHPGAILKELYLEPLGVRVTETACSLGVSRKTLSAILNERAGISPEMALRRARSFDTTPESWLNLQQQYDLWQVQNKGGIMNIKVLFTDTEKRTLA